jgi:hypothetical protein
VLPFVNVSRAGPRIVGRYAIYEEIASGGMASVHFARLVDPSGSARTVAIKRAHPHLARDAEFALMFLDEARLATSVRHANVVSTIDVLSTADDLGLVMEYVHGESLWRLMRAIRERGERVPLPIAASILTDALHGLHAAHEATDERGGPLGIVHRDVSPQNIIVGVDGRARLVDFGIAKAAGRLHSTRDSSVKGKYAYMAPEQVRGQPVSRLTDTYAAAIVLWELLTGERLFVGKTEAETIHKCLVGRVPPPSVFVPELGTKIDDILRKGLSREPARRYQTAREMALDLESCVPAIDPSDVGAWVEQLAGEALAARAEVLADIERGAVAAVPTIAEELRPASRTSSRRAAIVSLLLVAALGAVGAVALGARTKAPVAPPTETAVSGTPEAPPSTSTPVAVQPTVVPSTPSASTAEASARPAPATSSTAARPPTRTGPRSTHPKRGACDPPYSIDSQGRQIFKPECM